MASRELVVFEHDARDDALVIFDPKSNSVQVARTVARPRGFTHAQAASGAYCPYCRRSFASTGNAADTFDLSSATNASSATTNSTAASMPSYFRLLERTLLPAPSSRSRSRSRSPSPRSQKHNKQQGLDHSTLNSGYYRKFFMEERKIGSGGFGSVFLCTHVLEGEALGRYAVKVIPVGDSHTWLLGVLREVHTLATLSSPQTVDYKHAWVEEHQIADFGPHVPCLFILMQYCNAGSLADRVFQRRANKLVEEDVIWKWLIDMVTGVHHLHSRQIVHRDIKPENMLLHIDVDDDITLASCLSTEIIDQSARVLISDFGQAERVARSERLARSGNTGTLLYAAPELLLDDADYDEAVDVYGLGMCLYTMAYGCMPWDDSYETPLALYERITKGEPLKCPLRPVRSERIKSLIVAMTQRDPRQRITMEQLLVDTSLRGHDFRGILPVLGDAGSTRDADANSSKMIIRSQSSFRFAGRSTPLALPAPSLSPVSRFQSKDGPWKQIAHLCVPIAVGAITTWNGGWTAMLGLLGCVGSILLFIARDYRHLVPSMIALFMIALGSESNTYQVVTFTAFVFLATLFSFSKRG